MGSSGINNWLQSFLLYFQGGVRRKILIFLGICLVLLAPIYFLGQIGSTVWANVDLNPNKLQNKSIVLQKLIQENEFGIDRSQNVPLANNETVLYTTINNRQNPLIGYFPFTYRLQVLDKQGSVIENKIESSYLLPEEFKYIVASTGNDKADRLIVSTIEDESRPVLFNPYSINLASKVSLDVRNPTVLSDPNSTDLTISAYVKNNDLVDIKKLDVLYLIRDRRDRVVGVGQYQLEYLKAGEERFFSLKYPKPKFRTAVSLEVRPFVNYLDKNNLKLPQINSPEN
jgi:hypothetical protein